MLLSKSHSRTTEHGHPAPEAMNLAPERENHLLRASFPYHLRAAFRAILDGARLAPHVGHLRAAARTNAVAARSGPIRAAHLTTTATHAPAAALSTALSTALSAAAPSWPGSILSWHRKLLSILLSTHTCYIYYGHMPITCSIKNRKFEEILRPKPGQRDRNLPLTCRHQSRTMALWRHMRGSVLEALPCSGYHY